jgi:hypothetical protein
MRLFSFDEGGRKPGNPEIAKSLSLAGVFDWYQDYPQQIARAVLGSS